MIARSPIPWLDKCRKYNHLIGHISNSNFKFKFSNFQIQNKLLSLSVFVAENIFKIHQHFCFLCFHSRRRFFWFYKDIEITKNIFPLAENNFGERNFVYGNETGSPGRAVSLHPARSGSQWEHSWIHRILPARGACHIISKYYYSTMMSFYHIWSRERAKYETVIHCSVPVWPV